MAYNQTLFSFLLLSTVSVFVLAADGNESCFLARDTGNSGCGQAGAKSFYFHKPTRTCQPFFYQGCDGNENRFASKKECEDACRSAEAPGDLDTQQVCASGAYAAGSTSGEKVTCAKCPHGYECQNDKCCPTKEFTCSLQYDAGRFGTNGKHIPRYFYNKNYKNCMLFTFYGRDGNANNFATFNECHKFCG